MHKVYREKLLGALIGLARACENNPKTENTDGVVVEILAACAGQKEISEGTFAGLLDKIQEEKDTVSPGCASCACPCGNTAAYDMSRIGETGPDAVKWRLIDGICRLACSMKKEAAPHKTALGLFYRVLPMVSYELEEEDYLSLMSELEGIRKSYGGISMSGPMKNITKAEVLTLKELVAYQEGQVVSKTLAQNDAVSVTLFSFDKGEEISTHESKGDAFVTCLDGVGKITIDRAEHLLREGQSIVMPAGHPHAVFGEEQFKMLLVVVF